MLICGDSHEVPDTLDETDKQQLVDWNKTLYANETAVRDMKITAIEDINGERDLWATRKRKKKKKIKEKEKEKEEFVKLILSFLFTVWSQKQIDRLTEDSQKAEGADKV